MLWVHRKSGCFAFSAVPLGILSSSLAFWMRANPPTDRDRRRPRVPWEALSAAGRRNNFFLSLHGFAGAAAGCGLRARQAQALLSAVLRSVLLVYKEDDLQRSSHRLEFRFKFINEKVCSNMGGYMFALCCCGNNIIFQDAAATTEGPSDLHNRRPRNVAWHLP